MGSKQFLVGGAMKSKWGRRLQASFLAIALGILFSSVSPLMADGNAPKNSSADSAIVATPVPEINGEGSFDGGPNGGHPQFFIIDVENEQVTKKYLEGEFGYSDHRSHVTFTTGKIETVTINGNQGAFTGTATIGGRHRQKVQFTVTVTANQNPTTGDTFSIVLSNGYSASGNLRNGFISIQQIDPFLRPTRRNTGRLGSCGGSGGRGTAENQHWCFARFGRY